MPERAKPLHEEVEQLRLLVVSQQVQIDHMKLLIAKLRRMQFGRSSEKLSREIEQLELQLEEMQTAIAPVEAAVDASDPRPSPVRQSLPEHLPREKVVHQPACTCPGCGGGGPPLAKGSQRARMAGVTPPAALSSFTR